MRRQFIVFSLLVAALNIAFYLFYPPALWNLVLLGPIVVLGYVDMFQTSHTIRRIFPVMGHFRYLFEKIRPEINQYFVESDTDGVPFSREQRSLVYQRAKKVLDTLPFGTRLNVNQPGYEWINHSFLPTHIDPDTLRVEIGEGRCKHPYSASILNISAMSYGALSDRAILSLGGGAKDGNFAMNTGEGGISPFHLKYDCDLIWQIGTGYFGCRTPDGKFCAQSFQEKACLPQVKMIELKISQGAKPAHGGILPGAKVTEEISKIRGVPLGKDVISPPAHAEFSTPIELLEFIEKLRDLSGGKPVGFKICLGRRREFLAVCKAMKKTGIYPDFIVVDGTEGGTGAAPLEFSNYIGWPGIESIIFVHNALQGYGLRDQVKVIASGRVISAFDIVKRLAVGADLVYSARGMMLALGCIQALRCNSNHCPAGIATQDPNLTAGIVVSDKRRRVYNYHNETVASLAHMLEAMGLHHSSEVRPWHLMRRTSTTEVKHYGEIFEFVDSGCLLQEPYPDFMARANHAASADSFYHSS